jgi:hypothetical protein
MSHAVPRPVSIARRADWTGPSPETVEGVRPVVMVAAMGTDTAATVVAVGLPAATGVFGAVGEATGAGVAAALAVG